MTSVGVKGLNLFQSATVSAKPNVQSVDQSESFDDTFSSMKSDNDADKTFEAGAKVNKRDRAKMEELGAAKTRNPVKPEEEISEEQMVAAAEEIVSQIRQVLMERFEVSEDVLTTTIEGLGLTEESLMNPAELTKVVMKLEGIEKPADMLTNPEIMTELKDILAEVENIKETVTVDNLPMKDATTLDVETSIKDVETQKVVEDADKNVELNKADEVDANELEPKANTDTDVDVEVEVDVDVDADTETATEINTETLSNTTSNMTSDGDDSNGLLQHKETKDNPTENKVIGDNQAIQPQDFAAKLTEDLTEKVGETKANDIVRQVIEQAQVQAKQGVTSMEMQLYPEHLGKVLIQVVSHDGSVTAQITAESEAAKSALESQLTLLKENLVNQGIKVESVEVTIASHAFEQNMQGERQNEQGASQGRRGRKNAMSFFDDTNGNVAETETDAILESIGSTVSYSA